MTRNEIVRTICCPSGICCSPSACYAEDRSRSYPVDIHTAAARIEQLQAKAIHEACEATIRAAQHAWRNRDTMATETGR
jgi:hypothetical protein